MSTAQTRTVTVGVTSRPPSAPRNEIERELAVIFQELLGVDRVGVNDDFFDLGGHSLVAVRMFARVKKKYRVDLPLSILFEESTIDGLARVIGEELGIDASSGMVDVDRAGAESSARNAGGSVGGSGRPSCRSSRTVDVSRSSARPDTVVTRRTCGPWRSTWVAISRSSVFSTVVWMESRNRTTMFATWRRNTSRTSSKCSQKARTSSLGTQAAVPPFSRWPSNWFRSGKEVAALLFFDCVQPHDRTREQTRSNGGPSCSAQSGWRGVYPGRGGEGARRRPDGRASAPRESCSSARHPVPLSLPVRRGDVLVDRGRAPISSRRTTTVPLISLPWNGR